MGRADYAEAVSWDGGLAGADPSGNDPEFMDNTGIVPGQVDVRMARLRLQMLMDATDNPELTAQILSGDKEEEMLEMILRGEQ